MELRQIYRGRQRYRVKWMYGVGVSVWAKNRHRGKFAHDGKE